MKILLLTIGILSAFSLKAKEDVLIKEEDRDLTILLGLGKSSFDYSELPVYSFMAYKDVKKNEMSFVGGFDFGSLSEQAEGTNIKVKEKIFNPYIGFTYGIKDKLTIIPTVGYTFWDRSETLQGLPSNKTYNYDEKGFNIGLDLMLQYSNNINLGIGMRQHLLDFYDATQFSMKFGFDF